MITLLTQIFEHTATRQSPASILDSQHISSKHNLHYKLGPYTAKPYKVPGPTATKRPCPPSPTSGSAKLKRRTCRIIEYWLLPIRYWQFWIFPHPPTIFKFSEIIWSWSDVDMCQRLKLDWNLNELTSMYGNCMVNVSVIVKYLVLFSDYK